MALARTVRPFDTPRWLSKRLGRVVLHATLVALGLVNLYPFLWTLGSSLKSPGEFFRSGLNPLPEQLQWGNYVYAWEQGRFGQYFANTAVVAVSVTVLVVLIASMAGYVLARTEVPGRKVVLGGMLALMFLPHGYTIIPTFDLVQRLGLLNTLWSVILVQTAGALIFNTLLYLGYFRTISREIEEAARIDGASPPTVYLRIMLPLAKPMTATVALFQFMQNWNCFWIPLVFTIGNPDLRTLAVGMYAFAGENSTGWTYLCAGAVITVLPILAVFFFLQRYFIEAVAGAIKG
ncbi:MAG TPA: carbohydrate ABC transporter permease [Chloroflexota bacterium]